MGATKKPPVGKAYIIKRTIDIILAIALAAGVFFGLKHLFSDRDKISNERPEAVLSVVEDSVPTVSSGDQTIYTSEEVSNNQVYKGSLILVSNEHECKLGDDGELVSILAKKSEEDVSCYSVKDGDVSVRKETMTNLNAMMTAFYAETDIDDVQVISGYRSKERQQELYEAELEENNSDSSDLVSKPGYSEHQTGYAIDIKITRDGENIDFDGSGDYSWLAKNGYKYGFVQRYEKDKADITGIDNEPWHFRYVGTPHAYYMRKNKLCLEEYIDEIRNYPYGGLPLEFADSNGEIYQIYFVEMDKEGESTMVPVPEGEDYTILGNNVDGFIVTVDTGKKQEKTKESKAEESSKSEKKKDSKKSEDASSEE